MNASGLEVHQWARLHPLSPIIRFGRAIVALLVVFASTRFPVGGPGHSFVLDYAFLFVAILAGFISWLVTRWRVHNSELQIETGLLRRQSIRIPLSRIQAIDVVRPLLARFFGLAELQVVVAGRGANRSRLAYLHEEEAVRVRAQLLALAHGLAQDTPEPMGERFFELDNGRFVASILIFDSTVIGLLFFLGLIALMVFTTVGVGILAVMLPTAIGFGQGLLRRLNSEFDLSLAEAPDGLRVESGLLQTRAETIPYGRIQAARLVEPLLWRPFGWCRLEIDVARQASERRSSGSERVARAILPVGTIEDGRRLLGRIMPEASTTVPPSARPPLRARFKAPLAYHNLAAWNELRYLYCRTGRLRRALVVLPLDKAQSLRRVQGPIQRALRLATLHVDSAGRSWTASALSRDATETESWLFDLVDIARHARRTMTRPGT